MSNKRNCKVCGDPINMTVFGMPDDICWGCSEKEEVLITNLEFKNDKQTKR
jgi:hypothetical protein